MRGEFKGKFYVEVLRSERFIGPSTMYIKEFDTEHEQQQYIMEYNTYHLDYQGSVPDVYTMAQEASLYDIHDYIRSIVK